MAEQKIKNMDEFAVVCGISRPTLSKYFSNPDSVRPSTRERIEKAVELHKYRPNLHAIHQNRRVSKTIGIVVPYLADPFFAEIVSRMEKRCIAAGFWPIVVSSHGATEMEAYALETLQSARVAGALVAPLGEASDIERLQEFTEELPTVLFDTHYGTGQAFVGTDNFQSIGLMVDYLCRTGEPPCFLGMSSVNANAFERQEAYVRAMERLGHSPQVFPIESHVWDFEEAGFVEGKRLISSHAFTSSTILCGNDRTAIGLLAAAYASGLRVGRGPGCALRIAGHDDHPLARYTCPSLTTVAQDYASIVDRSVTLLFEMLENEGTSTPKQAERLEGKLVMRDSA